MKHLDEAIERQREFQRRRTIAWILFALLVPVSLLFWSEVIFGFGHFADVGLLQIAAEFIVAIFSTIGAVQMFRSGMRFNRMHSDTSQLLDESGDVDS
jgi:hypothetical protein